MLHSGLIPGKALFLSFNNISAKHTRFCKKELEMCIIGQNMMRFVLFMISIIALLQRSKSLLWITQISFFEGMVSL